jgi:hypothetical protein
VCGCVGVWMWVGVGRDVGGCGCGCVGDTRGVVHHETQLRLGWGRQFRPVLYALDNRKTDVLGEWERIDLRNGCSSCA